MRLPGLLAVLLAAVCLVSGGVVVSGPTSLHTASRPDSGLSHDSRIYRTCYVTQKIDHFGFSEDGTFKQRYLIADQHWKRNIGSMLFYTGNEGDITWFANNTGLMWNIAEELDAILVFAEHRYYGESLPFGNKSFSDAKHLNYLSSEQALADFAVLVQYLKNTIPGTQDTPVIAIGGSYGGMLAAWFRMKYPHIVIGALAASAPIWQFDSLVPCGTFYRIVTEDFKKSGNCCSESIRNSWAAIDRLASTEEGLNWLSCTFRLCSPLKTVTDAAAFNFFNNKKTDLLTNTQVIHNFRSPENKYREKEHTPQNCTVGWDPQGSRSPTPCIAGIRVSLAGGHPTLKNLQ